ncbi:hypothetical protein T12_7094 [Trichinella patagoniensis]|uniref:Uncharacterized protein n=1 Tax=Trichinella patagoniensis TaxID=990121 RepID=A0A0V1A1L7_9BILA|nr:hypothetical protein T12_7094 [Trichinella patagoniensis]
MRNANVKPKCVHLTKQRIVGMLKLSFALDYRLMTKNVASFGASTFLTVTCTREQQSHATVHIENQGNKMKMQVQ